jgi:hypothetical protein
MAVTIAEPTGTKKQSIARVELFTDAHLAPGDRSLVVHFEDARYDAEGALIPGSQVFGTRRVDRRFGDIASASVTAAGATVTVGQLAALISAAAYAFRQEDIDAAIAE